MTEKPTTQQTQPTLPSEKSPDAPFKTKDPVIGLYPSADQSELKAQYKRYLKLVFPQTVLQDFVLCDPTAETPYPTVRSRVNGVRLLIKLQGRWQELPDDMMKPQEMGLNCFPTWTLTEFREEALAWGF